MPFVLVELATGQQIERRACCNCDVRYDKSRVMGRERIVYGFRKDIELIVKKQDNQKDCDQKDGELNARSNLIYGQLLAFGCSVKPTILLVILIGLLTAKLLTSNASLQRQDRACVWAEVAGFRLNQEPPLVTMQHHRNAVAAG